MAPPPLGFTEYDLVGGAGTYSVDIGFGRSKDYNEIVGLPSIKYPDGRSHPGWIYENIPGMLQVALRRDISFAEAKRCARAVSINPREMRYILVGNTYVPNWLNDSEREAVAAGL
jgi:hypothetical protein